MDNKKFEQLIDMIINENEEQARELFHEIVVEKSREIYESIMDEEMMGEEDMEEGMGGQVGDLLDEINADEAGGMTEAEEDDADIKFDDEAEEDGEDLTKDLEDEHDDEDHHADMGGNEELEDRVVKIEDKLDELMAEFEEIMNGGDMDDEEVEMSMSSDEEEVMEAVQLQKVSVTHGDNGVQTKSTVAANSGAKGMDSKPVKFSGDDEAVPTGPKNPSNAYSKGETSVPGAGSFKNAPGHKSQDLGSTPKPVTKDGATGTHSPVAK